MSSGDSEAGSGGEKLVEETGGRPADSGRNLTFGLLYALGRAIFTGGY